MTSPLALYTRRVASGQLAPDAAQLQAVQALERLYNELVASGPPPRGLGRRVARWTGRSPAPTRGLYLWGGVGRGKTYLMDLLFGCLPFEDKLRQHFHRFMASVHDNLKQVRHREDPLDLIAEKLANRTRIICFDEFAVTDIADAMILGTLFSGLFARGVSLAATSNIAPDNLYRDGLQRQRFTPTIDLIKRHTEVVYVMGDLDYRLRLLERADVYQHPNGPTASQRLAQCFAAIAREEGDHGGAIDVLGRRIDYVRAADGVIWFDFEQICDGPRSQNDYIEIARCYQTVVLSNVPQFTASAENQARRFIALVDEFYDRRVKLILSAETSIGELYRGTKLQRDFRRTQSRLEEMRSRDYLGAAHRA